MQAVSRREREVVVDLSRLCFVTPFGAVVLKTMLDYASAKGVRRLRVLCPEDSDCVSYLRVSGLLKHVSHTASIEGVERPCERPPGWRSQTVLPLTRLSLSHKVEKVSQRIERKLDAMLGRSSEGWEAAKSSISSTVRELCQNVIDHANIEEGWVAAQKYRNGVDNSFYVEISIGDAGRGIRNSLCDRHVQFKNSTDARAISEMLEQGLSRRERGGMGYKVLQKAARQLDGQFLLRSGGGAARRERHGTGIELDDGLPAWPGTQLCTRLTCA